MKEFSTFYFPFLQYCNEFIHKVLKNKSGQPFFHRR